MEIGFMIALAVLGVIGAYMVGAIVRLERGDQRAAKVQGLLGDGDLGGWGRRMGFEDARTRGGTWRASALGGRAEVVCEFTSFEDLTRERPARMRFVVDLGERVPEGFVMTHAWEVARGAASYSGLAMRRYIKKGLALEPFTVKGDWVEVLALTETGFFVKTLELCDELGFAWVAPRVEGGRFELIVHDASFLLEGDADARVASILVELDSFVSHLHARLSVRVSLERLAEGTEPELAARRWEAVEALAERHPEALAELAGRFVELSPTTQAGLARWGEPPGVELAPATRYRVLREVSERDGLGVMEVLEQRYRWHLLVDESVDTYVRMESARGALDAPDAPGDAAARDAALVRMFGSRVSQGRMSLGLVFADLARAGWEPAPQAARELVIEGDLPTREALLRHIERRGARASDAPALDALASEYVRGAAELLASLDLDGMQGNLSLADDDAARGALSQAAARGGLTAHDDHGTSE
jgi:hypothetical protein